MDIWTELGRYSFFETDRLYLRPFAFSDCDDFWEICSSSKNLQFIFPSQATKEESNFLLVHYFMKEPLGVWAIEDKKTHKMVGAIRFEKMDIAKKSSEIGYFLNQNFWRKGLMVECLKNLTFLAFQEFGLKKLQLIVHEENYASRRVAIKASFNFFRQFKGSDRYTRKMRNYVEYQISKGDYRYE